MTRTLEALSRDERSLLLFLETRAVDYCGRVNGVHMNAADFAIAKRWAAEKFIAFGRVIAKCITSDGAHWVELSDEAWALAHAERKARAVRLWLERGFITTAEKRAGGEA